MINKAKLDLMKPSACIINTSRGGVINEADLIQTLQENKILGAGLDTFDQRASAPEFPFAEDGQCGYYTPLRREYHRQ